VLGRDTPYLDVVNDIDWHERRKLLKVAFGFAVTPDSATYEIPYGTIGRSGRPRTQAERAKFEVPGQRWADVSGADYGVSVLNDGKYGWDYHDGVLRLSLLKAPIWPDSTADRGRHHFRFAVYPHAGDWRAARTVRRAAEYNVPLLAAREAPHPGALGRAVSFASAEPANVQLAWLKRAEDGDRWVVRLVEWDGLATRATVSLRCPVARAWSANLLEDPGSPLVVQNGRVGVSLRPHEIATLLVECHE
jgi:alpha-mannosidase